MRIDFDEKFLKNLLEQAEIPGPPKDTSFEPTAVFLPVFYRPGESFILAILKADNQGYPWRNQVALPGGHIDKNDKTPLDAAYRELEEEVGISRNQMTYIGSLGHFQTIAHKDIEVFLGIWDGNEKNLKYDPQEISKILKIHIIDLLKIHISSQFYRREPDIIELVYPVQELIIWGVTARILHYFIELLLNKIHVSSLNNDDIC